MVPLTLRSTSFSSSERTRMLSSLWISGVEVGAFMTGSLSGDGGAHISRAVAPVFVQQPIFLYNTEAQDLRGGAGTFSRTVRFQTMPQFYLDVLDGDRVIEDPEGIDFADRETAIAEVFAGARDLVAHGIMQ